MIFSIIFIVIKKLIVLDIEGSVILKNCLNELVLLIEVVLYNVGFIDNIVVVKIKIWKVSEC